MAVNLNPYPVHHKGGWSVADPSGVRRRVWLFVGLLALIYLGLLGRLWYLQVLQGDDMLAQAQHNRMRKVPLPAPRGLVLDRNDVVLATSRSSHSVAVVPAALPSASRERAKRLQILNTLSFLLGEAPEDIETLLQDAKDRGGHMYDPVQVADDVDLKTITLVAENKPRLGPAVMITDDIQRAYPNGALAAHVLGYTGLVTAEDMAQAQQALARDPAARQPRFDDRLGKSGIEKQYDNELSGQPGSDLYEVDARLRPVRHFATVPEQPGKTLVLTLDTRLQKAAEAALGSARNSGAAVAIDPRNGEVLALASRPGFDPNLFSLPPRFFKDRYRDLVGTAAHPNLKTPMINRAVTARFAPGSTFKMVTASAGLQQGTLRPGMVHSCGGGLRMGRFFGCWKTHGSIDLMGAIAQSCDVYFYETALNMGNPESTGPAYLARVARQFGLGGPTKIDLATDGSGLIPDPAWRRRVNEGNPGMARWYPGNTLNMSIGQGDVLVTPLQMALVTSAVANGGTLWRPHVLKSVLGKDRKVIRSFAPVGQSVGISGSNLDIVREGMRRVVTDGTGRAVALPNVAVAGKTGSAEDAHHSLPHAWFVCFAPFDHPTIAIACIVENSGHGAENAAPVAKRILQAAFPAGNAVSARTRTARAH